VNFVGFFFSSIMKMHGTKNKKPKKKKILIFYLMFSKQRHFPPWSEIPEVSWPKRPSPKVEFDSRMHKLSHLRLWRYPDISPTNSQGWFRELNIGSSTFFLLIPRIRNQQACSKLQYWSTKLHVITFQNVVTSNLLPFRC